jgi:hypothetical protein
MPRLGVGGANDAAERSADGAASSVTGGGTTTVGPMSSPRTVGTVSSDLQSRITRSAGRGRPLPAGEQSFFGRRMGVDFSQVRVHSDQEAAGMAADLGARAFTVGQDVFFGAGRYQPSTGPGRHLLAHELAHTVQQGDGPPVVQRQEDEESWRERAARWREESGEWVDHQSERADRFLDRQAERANRVLDRGSDWVDRRSEQAGRALDRAQEEAEEWWESGSGAVTHMDFDGSTLRLHGSVSFSAPAVSGLRASNRRSGGTDWTGPAHQDVPNKGPIPEGEYYVVPDEVENHRTHRFNSGPWGYYRVRLHETLMTSGRRRLSTDRTGGFFVHKDGGNDGTAGCIGLQSHAANKTVHDHIAANGARIPVHVDYPEPVASETAADSDAEVDGDGR